jgi:hypothetical protein
LRSAAQIASILVPADAPDPAAMDALLRQLETGLPARALDLLNLPVLLGRGEYLALVEAGVTTVSRLWAMEREELQAVLSPERAKQMEQHRPAHKT